MSPEHFFADSLGFSDALRDAPWWEACYRAFFPSFQCMASIKNDGWAQRAGIDRIVTLTSGRQLKVDEKARRVTYDDVFLEYWSSYERRVPGWVAKDLDVDYI